MTDMRIAHTIQKQIGAKTLFMLGAKNLAGGENYLSFRIRGSKKVNYVKISLNTNDLYTMEFGKVWGLKYTKKTELENIYADQMHEMIERETGLVTRFPEIRID